jgi:ABC-type multidrug transport system ATPase subunit
LVTHKDGPGDSARAVVDIDAISIRRRHNQFRLDVEQLALRRGTTALVGANGSGKTTLIECIAGFHGRRVSGRRVTGGNRNVAYVPQATLLPSTWSVSTYFEYIGWLRGLSRSRCAVERAVLERKLSLSGSARLGRLSGGFQRRVAIGSAFIGDASVVLLDEPYAALDDASADAVSDLVQEQAERAICIADHTGRARDRAKYVWMIKDGNLECSKG